MPNLVDKVVILAEAFESSAVPYAFGGALALAYATEEPRGTRDIGVNVFVAVEGVQRVRAALPSAIAFGDDAVALVERDEQVRVWWDDTPVDLFFAAHEFHIEAGRQVHVVDFVGRPIRVLAPADLAVFKVLFDRSRDWVDIEAMLDSGTLDLGVVVAGVRSLLDDDDPRIERLRALGR